MLRDGIELSDLKLTALRRIPVMATRNFDRSFDPLECGIFCEYFILDSLYIICDLQLSDKSQIMKLSVLSDLRIPYAN